MTLLATSTLTALLARWWLVGMCMTAVLVRVVSSTGVVVLRRGAVVAVPVMRWRCLGVAVLTATSLLVVADVGVPSVRVPTVGETTGRESFTCELVTFRYRLLIFYGVALRVFSEHRCREPVPDIQENPPGKRVFEFRFQVFGEVFGIWYRVALHHHHLSSGSVGHQQERVEAKQHASHEKHKSENTNPNSAEKHRWEGIEVRKRPFETIERRKHNDETPHHKTRLHEQIEPEPSVIVSGHAIACERAVVVPFVGASAAVETVARTKRLPVSDCSIHKIQEALHQKST